MLLRLSLVALASFVPQDESPQSAPGHRVLCWNVWNGFEGGETIADGAAWIAGSAPDVVALQELVGFDTQEFSELGARWGHGHTALAKVGGYPVGLTARGPIEVIERRTEGLHHGYLHARVEGVDYLVVHLHPGSWEFRLRESAVVAAKAAELVDAGRAVVVLGDFNAHAAVDRRTLATRRPLLRRRTEQGGGNLRGDAFDHEVMARITSAGLVDVVERHAALAPGFGGTFPTRIFPSTAKEADQAGLLERIDHVLCDARSGALVESVQLPRQAVLDRVSDHYPIIVDFSTRPSAAPAALRPNIVLILADDLGFSDLGCYGSEIPTPNLDRLAAGGLRFTHFTNTSKCSPSRACLLTGAYAQAVEMHQAPAKIIGGLTFAQLLGRAGYRCYMSGKHHGTQNPIELGFDRYFGLRDGACNHFNPGKRRENEPQPAQKRPNRVWRIAGETKRPFTPDDPNFYTTDAFTDAALEFLDEGARADEPFLLYVAYTAPHDPLQAPNEDIERHAGIYDAGYAAIRSARLERQRELGLFGDAAVVPSDAEHGDWESLDEAKRTDQARRMQVYAAMIDRLDQNVGRIVDALEERDLLDSTMILFASDNGASAENVAIGEGAIGSVDRWASLQKRWANVSNTPFRKFKNSSFEGGVRTPLIVHWPAGVARAGRTIHAQGHLVDVTPTLVDVAGAGRPASWSADAPVGLVAGQSLTPLLRGEPFARARPLFYEWWKGRAIRDGRWKLVQQGNEPWRLYDLERDPTEREDLAAQRAEAAARLLASWEDWRADPGFRGSAAR